MTATTADGITIDIGAPLPPTSSVQTSVHYPVTVTGRRVSGTVTVVSHVDPDVHPANRRNEPPKHVVVLLLYADGDADGPRTGLTVNGVTYDRGQVYVQRGYDPAVPRHLTDADIDRFGPVYTRWSVTSGTRVERRGGQITDAGRRVIDDIGRRVAEIHGTHERLVQDLVRHAQNEHRHAAERADEAVAARDAAANALIRAVEIAEDAGVDLDERESS